MKDIIMLRNSILQRSKSSLNITRSGNSSTGTCTYGCHPFPPRRPHPASSSSSSVQFKYVSPYSTVAMRNNYNLLIASSCTRSPILKCFQTTPQLSKNVLLHSSHATSATKCTSNTMMITTRNYIFFETNNVLLQMKQNIESVVSSVLGNGRKKRSHYNSYYRLQKGKQIMIRLKMNTKEQMKIHGSRLRKYILDSTNSSSTSIVSTNANTSRRYRFRQWRRNKQAHLTNYYTHKRSIIKRKTQHIWTKFRLHKASMKEWTLLYKKNAHTRYLNMKTDLAQYKYSKYAVTITEPFRKEWFTNDGYPFTARDPRTGRFVNPWKSESTNGWKRLEEVWRWKKTRLIGYDIEHGLKHQQTTRTNDTDTCVQENQQPLSIPMQLSPPTSSDKIKLTWVGHATMLVQLAGFTILTDPVFSKKASPVQYFSETEFFGVPRRLPPSISIDDIPDVGVDICLISHDHYDHLDYDSVLQLAQKDLVKVFVVPLGIREWLIKEAGVDSDKIIELEWWQSVKFKNNNNGGDYFSVRNKLRLDEVTKPFGWRPSNSNVMEETLQSLLNMKNSFDSSFPLHRDENEIVLTCAPAQHWASRTPFDRNTRLWCSWAVHASTGFDKKDLSFYFSGDTGYPKSFPLFRQIGDYLGENINVVLFSHSLSFLQQKNK
jgi:L-ascorbate metabolism protein UlaG (beta-lactamase superfamily)